MKNNNIITNWVINTVKKEYANDIALVISHNTLKLDDTEDCLGYFVPITDKGYSFGQTFIIDGVGFDIWGVDWDRLERFANLEEYNITCLADSKILYAKSKDAEDKFNALKKQQLENLNNPQIMRKNALLAFTQAKKIYLEMIFATKSDVLLGAGYTIDYLAQAIAFSNLSYFKRAQTYQLEELSLLPNIPKGFSTLYNEILLQNNGDTQKKLCYELILLVQKFLENQNNSIDDKKNTNFAELADWYQELSYTFLRIRHYTKLNDYTRVYMWGIMLQEQLNNVCSDYGIPKKELMIYFDVTNLEKFTPQLNSIEEEIKSIIISNDVKIREYKNTEDFFNEI